MKARFDSIILECDEFEIEWIEYCLRKYIKEDIERYATKGDMRYFSNKEILKHLKTHKSLCEACSKIDQHEFVVDMAKNKISPNSN